MIGIASVLNFEEFTNISQAQSDTIGRNFIYFYLGMIAICLLISGLDCLNNLKTFLVKIKKNRVRMERTDLED